MICQKTFTQSSSEDGAAELEANPEAQQKSQPQNETVVSEADQRKIAELELERAKHPRGTKEYKRLSDAIYFRRHRQKFNDYSNAWQKSHRNIAAARLQSWRKRNPDKRKAESKRHQANRANWAKKNKERRREISRKYYHSHKPPPKPPRILSGSARSVYFRYQRKTNIQFMLKDRLRASTNRAFRRQWIKKPHRTEALLGCTIEEAKNHIESQFRDGMSWQNRKSFVIDHHVPIVAFDLRDDEEVLLAFGWRNLKPLTGHENSTKSATFPSPLPSWLPPHIATRILTRQK